MGEGEARNENEIYLYNFYVFQKYKAIEGEIARYFTTLQNTLHSKYWFYSFLCSLLFSVEVSPSQRFDVIEANVFTTIQSQR